MTPVEAMHGIEGERFAALTNLASNLKTFLRIAAQQTEVETLSRSMAEDEALISRVYQRALALAQAATEQDHEAEGDAAMAAYLWLLTQHRPALAQTLATGLRQPGPFFWARKLAADMRTPGEVNGTRGAADGTGARDLNEDVAASERKP
jgi:hypothetical protein